MKYSLLKVKFGLYDTEYSLCLMSLEYGVYMSIECLYYNGILTVKYSVFAVKVILSTVK